MTCQPVETYCNGIGIIPCGCPCDRCEAHDMDCDGCVNCVPDEEVQEHMWVESLDNRYLVCVEPECGQVKIKAAA